MNFLIQYRHDLTWSKLVELSAPKMGSQFLAQEPMSNFNLKICFYKILFLSTICRALFNPVFNQTQGELAWPLVQSSPKNFSPSLSFTSLGFIDLSQLLGPKAFTYRRIGPRYNLILMSS